MNYNWAFHSAGARNAGVPESSEPEYRKYDSREILQAQNKEVSVNNKSRGEGLSQTNLVIVMNRRAQNNATI